MSNDLARFSLRELAYAPFPGTLGFTINPDSVEIADKLGTYFPFQNYCPVFDEDSDESQCSWEDFLYETPDLINNNLKFYGSDDPFRLSNFLGGYINFGFWESINRPITDEERKKASENLYFLVGKHLSIKRTDKLVEFGFGTGIGTEFIQSTFHPEHILAIDLTPEQVARANSLYKSTSITFQVGQAGKTGLASETADAIFSVEAVQHFPNIHNFLNESYFILKQGGRFVFCAHFAKDEASRIRLTQENLLVDEGIDQLTPLTTVLKSLELFGFENIRHFDLSSFVFPGFEAWLMQKKKEEDGYVPAGSFKLIESAKRGWIVYGLISGEKSHDNKEVSRDPDLSLYEPTS